MAEKRTKKMWFTMKHHGWGWVPITIEGWITSALFATSLYYFPMKYPEDPFKYIIMSIIAFGIIAYNKGPVPRWRWDKN